MEVPFFEYHLKGIGSPFPEVAALPSPDAQSARFHVTSERPLTDVKIYWARPVPQNPSAEDIKQREWIAAPAALVSEQTYQATLPADAGDWFALVSDDRPVTTSSGLVHLRSAAPTP